jgi:hypothetical protein
MVAKIPMGFSEVTRVLIKLQQIKANTMAAALIHQLKYQGISPRLTI